MVTPGNKVVTPVMLPPVMTSDTSDVNYVNYAHVKSNFKTI